MDSLKIGKHYYMLDCISHLILLVVGFVTTDYVQGTGTDYNLYPQRGQKIPGAAVNSAKTKNVMLFSFKINASA